MPAAAAQWRLGGRGSVLKRLPRPPRLETAARSHQAAAAILNTELMVKTKVIQEELEARKVIERAKDILMTRRGLSGVEAYRWIQKKSMDARKSMKDISEAIILTEEI